MQTTQLNRQLGKQTAMVNDMSLQGRILSKYEWGKTSDDLRQLSNIVQRGEALAYSSSNMDATYRQKYRGYDAYSRDRMGTGSTYSDQYSDWSKTNMDTIVSSMRAAKLQETQFSTEDQTMRTLEKMGETPEGRMQAIQIGNQIAAQQVRQNQKLRALIMAQMQMQASYMAHEANEKDVQKAKSEKFFRDENSYISINDGMKF